MAAFWTEIGELNVSSWGPGPFDSDAADDLLASLEPLTGERRSDTLMDVLREEVAGGEAADQALVLAAAAIISANIDPALWPEWNEGPEDPQILLDRTSLRGLREAALQAVEAVSSDSFMDSWQDLPSRTEVSMTIDRLRAVLQVP